MRENARQRVAEFDIRTQSIDSPAGTLSGGNQQKVVVAREMSRPLRLFIASQPTRGVDVGAMEFIHQRIVAERDLGTPVVIVSTELDEVVALADRIAVMYRGRIVGVVPPTATREQLGLLMAGVDDPALLAEAGGGKALDTRFGVGPARTDGPDLAKSDGGPADRAGTDQTDRTSTDGEEGPA
ncbi:hypothetical protein ACU686_28370 [Yinghuangia aomiensis]